MNTRRLVKSGYSSLVIAIPKEWIEKNKLKHKDEIYITEQDNKLIIQSEYKKKITEKKEKVIDIDSLVDKIIMREIASAYLNNYDYILLKGKTLKKRSKEIKLMISSLIALEVVDESSEKILAKNFLNLQDTDVPLLIRRMDNIVRSMIIDVKQSLTDKSLVENIVERDIEINKLNHLILRVLKTAYTDPSVFNYIGIPSSSLMPYWEVNIALEKIGDRIKHIAMIVPEIKEPCKKRFLQLIDKIEDYYKKSMKTFYESSVKGSDEVAILKEELRKVINDYTSHKCIACSKVAINLFNMIGHINDISRIVRYIVNDE